MTNPIEVLRVVVTLLVNSVTYNVQMPQFFGMLTNASIAGTAIEVVIGFILAMIATLIGANLIGPVATAVGGALKNGNLTGAANSLTAQITLIFVTLVIIGVVVFLAVLGKKAEAESP